MYGHTFILGILFRNTCEKKKEKKDDSCYLQNEVSFFPSTIFLLQNTDLTLSISNLLYICIAAQIYVWPPPIYRFIIGYLVQKFHEFYIRMMVEYI